MFPIAVSLLPFSPSSVFFGFKLRNPALQGRGDVKTMIVTADGSTLTPSLYGFLSDRPLPLKQLQGNWFAEKVFASDTGDTQHANLADPVILRDGHLGSDSNRSPNTKQGRSQR